MNDSILNNAPSTDLEYTNGRTRGNIWVSGALVAWTRTKDRMGSVAATNAVPTGRDYFYVNWQVEEPHSAQFTTDWARKFRFSVGAPIYQIDPYLNDLKGDVIMALLDLDLLSIARKKGYGFELSPKRYNIQWNKHTALFTIVLDDSHSSDTSENAIKGNIRIVHDAVGGKVEAVLKKLQVAEKLSKHFVDREPGV